MADLTVNINESVTLNNQVIEASHTLTISSVVDIFRRIVSIASGDDATVLVFKSTTAIADWALDKEKVKYLRITNLESSNSVKISLQLDSGEDNSAADLSVTHLLEAGKSFMMGSVDEAVHANDSSSSIITALTDLESIIVDSGSNNVQVEVFAASISWQFKE